MAQVLPTKPPKGKTQIRRIRHAPRGEVPGFSGLALGRYAPRNRFARLSGQVHLRPPGVTYVQMSVADYFVGSGDASLAQII